MKLLSALPSLVAKIGDLVQRDVTSDIEIHQEAVFPLLLMPGVKRPFSAFGLTTILTDSTMFRSILSKGASLPSTVTDYLTLGKGVWDLDFVVQYTATFANPGTVGFQFFLQDTVTASILSFVNFAPVIDTLVAVVNQRITLDRSDLALRSELTATGVGQTHAFNLSVSLNKML